MDNPEKQIDQYLMPFSDEISSLARQLREYLRNETKPAFEIIGESHHSLNIGFGFTEKVWDCYCAINTYSNHINISFPSGSSLTDPEDILIGSGSKIRHIRIHNFDDIKEQKITRLLNEARKKAYGLVEKHREYYEPIYTIFKNTSARKEKTR
jgi:hypothetical protein